MISQFHILLIKFILILKKITKNEGTGSNPIYSKLFKIHLPHQDCLAKNKGEEGEEEREEREKGERRETWKSYVKNITPFSGFDNFEEKGEKEKREKRKWKREEWVLWPGCMFQVLKKERKGPLTVIEMIFLSPD